MTLKAVFLHGTVVIDGLLVSSLGEVSLAAMGLAAAIGGLVSGVIFAFSNALQLRTAQAYGTDDTVFRKSVLASGIALGLGIGAIGLAVIWVFGSDLVVLMAPTADMATQAWTYLSIFSLVILAEALGQNLASHFNGCGRARLPLYGYCLSVPLNIGASVILIHGLFGMPAYGIAGAAIGSALAAFVQTAYLTVQVIRKDGDLWHVQGWHNTTFSHTLRRHIKFSWPIAVTFVSANFAHAFAAMTLIMPWIMVGGTLGMQWAQATGIFVAQLLGERRSEPDLDRFLKSAWRMSFVAAGLVALIYLLLCLSPPLLYPSLAPETQSILMGFAVLLVILPFPKQSNAICGNTLRASGDTHYVMHIFVWSQWLFRVPATAIAVFYLDISPLWILSLLLWEEVLKFPAFHRRLWRGDWKKSNVAI
jgi:Na+-driven multidrug efflux pump